MSQNGKSVHSMWLHARRSTLCRVVAGYHPPTRTYVYHQHATLKPSALGESGWASCVARASRVCTKPPGRRVRHFGGRHRISCYRIRWPGEPLPVCAPRRPRRCLSIDSGLVQAGFAPIWPRSCVVPIVLLEGWYRANTDRFLSRTRALGACGGIGTRR